MKTLKVKAIKNGTVIDHVPSGKGQEIIDHLNLEKNTLVMLGINLSSKLLRRKDIIKIENKELTPEEASQVAIIAPKASLNIIRNFEIAKKEKVEIPDAIFDVLKCPNPNCISNVSDIPSKFKVLTKHPFKVRCHYCERDFKDNEIVLK